MNEKQWTARIARAIEHQCLPSRGKFDVRVGHRLPYGFEITGYDAEALSKSISYETDVLIGQYGPGGVWIPRVVIESKLRLHTHDAITYSEKAASHKAVHPYLRYGIMLGNRRQRAIPGRLFRHGDNFDFMFSFRGLRPSTAELASFRKLLRSEVKASQTLEEAVYASRRPDRHRYRMLHRKLVVE